ncbi:G5 domain-containing protein [Candidatus Saccharibacteria bacterium]|nr:G5 domain-containing protein [Candidatus Saccharibacteria bacterium]
MRLPRNVESILVAIIILVLSFVSVVSIGQARNNTFAETEDFVFSDTEDYFVTFYDNGQRLTVKTTAITVGEALERAGIVLNETDIVEPKLDEKINSDNFFINIYRSHPAVIKDGKFEKYLMTASYDARTVAKEAGITVYDSDEIKLVQNRNFLEAGVAMVYEVTRNGGRTLTEEIEIPFEEETVKDYNLEPGTREVRQFGEIGTKLLTYEVFYENNVEVTRKLISEEVKREPVTRIVAVGASEIERHPLTAAMGRNRYTFRRADGVVIERQETYYDLNMSGVMLNAARTCGVEAYYAVREDGVKVDADGYVLVAANLDLYPRCSVVETSLGLGKVYDTGSFAVDNPEQFDIATDWTNRNGQ